MGLMQIPVSFLLYTIFAQLFQSIPLFILFIVIATPAIYFIQSVLVFNWRNILLILTIGVIAIITHPVVALVAACIVSIYDLS